MTHKTDPPRKPDALAAALAAGPLKARRRKRAPEGLRAKNTIEGKAERQPDKYGVEEDGSYITKSGLVWDPETKTFRAKRTESIQVISTSKRKP